MTSSGDMQFGLNAGAFFVNSPAGVAQLVLTRLRLFTGEWFLDQTAGTPWLTQVLGKYTSGLYDSAIRSVILATQGVLGIASYSSTFDATKRTLAVSATVNTIYSTSVVAQQQGGAALPGGGAVTFAVSAS